MQLRRGALVFERRIVRDAGRVVLHQRITGHDTRRVVTHDAGMTAFVEVRRGRLFIPLPRGEVAAPARFTLSLPPRSVIALRFADADVISEGSGAFGAPDTPPSLTAGTQIILDPDAGLPAPVVRARRALHAAITSAAPVRHAARAAGVAPETVARWFADAYGLAPKHYCQRARLFDAAILLLDGAQVLDAALRAGFNDLTRFYAQFRRVLGATPRQYAPGSRTAKRAPAAPA